MPYLIGLYFDKNTEPIVRKIWKKLADLNLADYFSFRATALISH
jgi:hypothetical protein